MGFLVAQTVKNLPVMQETWVQSLGWEDPLEKGRATHSSILSWRSPWTEEPNRLQFMGSQRVGYDWATNVHIHMCVCGRWSIGGNFPALKSEKLGFFGALILVKLPHLSELCKLDKTEWHAMVFLSACSIHVSFIQYIFIWVYCIPSPRHTLERL